MKQKEYFEILQQRQHNAGYYYDGPNQNSHPPPQSLHQLKKNRGAILQRSYSDIGYRQNNSQHYHNELQHQQQQHQRRQQTETMLTRNSSSAGYSSKRNNSPKSSVQRSYSDSVRLVQYRKKPNHNFDNEYRQFTQSQRPSSVDRSNRQPIARHPQRPASVDLTTNRRPRSILKKASSASDLNINRSFEEDLIFDDEYLDFKSPRDVLSKNTQHGSAPNLNYSFEDGLSRGNVSHTRPMSPKVVKRVNFISEPTFFRMSPKSPRNPTPNDGYIDDFTSPRGYDHSPRIINGDASRGHLGWAYLQPELPPRTNGKSKASVKSNEGTPVKRENNNNNDDNEQKQPYEIRKPLFNTDSNVVDFGTFISRKLSKLKINKNKKKDKEKKPETFKTQNGESVRTSLDGNFTMLPHTEQSNEGSPARRDNFIDQEVLY